MKSPLTLQQKEKFETGFAAIMEKVPKLKEQWNGHISWSPADFPAIDEHIKNKLPGNLFGEYLNLLHKVTNRTI